jgi:hypothetical protein
MANKEPDVEGHAYKKDDEADALRDPEALKEAEANREPDVEGHAYKAQSGAEADEEPDVEGHGLKGAYKQPFKG